MWLLFWMELARPPQDHDGRYVWFRSIESFVRLQYAKVISSIDKNLRAHEEGNYELNTHLSLARQNVRRNSFKCVEGTLLSDPLSPEEHA